MWFVLSFVAVMLVCAAVIDVRARRRRTRYTGVDGAAARDERRKNEADLRTRSHQPDHGSFTGPF